MAKKGLFVNPIVLIAIGICIVLGSILWLRLHAFLALTLGAFVVSALTSEVYLQESMRSKFLGDSTRIAIQELIVQKAADTKLQGGTFDLRKVRVQSRFEVMENKVLMESAAQSKAIAFSKNQSIMSRITTAIGETCAKIGLLIATACVVGRCMLTSGAAERIVRDGLMIVGERNAPIAFSFSTFILGIPVFFDSVFLLTIPLAKATWLKHRKNYLLHTLALISGGTITHSLVPPTPGPLFVAKELGVGIGLMIVVGIAVGMCCTLFGLAFAYWVNGRMDIPVRDTPEAMKQLQKLSSRSLSDLPPLWLSLAPILLPVVLISGATIYESNLDPTQSVPSVIALLGDTNVALSLAAVIAMFMSHVYTRQGESLADQVQQAIQEAGVILLVCCGGGAFGAALHQTGVGPFIQRLSGSEPLDFALLPLAFLVTAVIRTAQGSSTVAMLTAVEIVRSLAPDLQALSYHPVYLAVAIGCGSKLIPWMNDSGFWVICKMSGLTEKEMLKTQSPMVGLMGVVGILVTMLAAKLVPLTY